MQPENHFTLLDIARLLGGFLLLNSLLSYWFTSSTTWGYEGRLLDPRYYEFLITHPFELEEFTIDTLSEYDGTNAKLPIYLGINGTVYDVSTSRDLYEPGTRYHILAGHDYSRVFVNGCFHRRDQYSSDLRGLDEGEIEKRLGSWVKYFEKNPKYWKVGTFKPDPSLLEQEAPPICEDGLKYPGSR